MNNPLFALDIITQPVTENFLIKNETSFAVIDHCTKEHHEKSMFNGSIHDIIQEGINKQSCLEY